MADTGLTYVTAQNSPYLNKKLNTYFQWLNDNQEVANNVNNFLYPSSQQNLSVQNPSSFAGQPSLLNSRKMQKRINKMQNIVDNTPNTYSDIFNNGAPTWKFKSAINNIPKLDTDFEVKKPNPFGPLSMEQYSTTPQNKWKKAFKPGGIGQIALGAAANVAGNVGRDDQFKRGMWDRMDPLFYAADGRESKIGNAMSDAGTMLTQTGLSTGNYWLALAGGIAKAAGSGYNALAGLKVDEAALKAAEESAAKNKNFLSMAQDWDELRGPEGLMGLGKIYHGSPLKSGNKENRDIQRKVREANDWAWRSIYNNANNIADDYMNNYLGNYAAYGGYIGQPDFNVQGVLDYDLASDYLNLRRKQIESKDTGKNLLAGISGSNVLANGGKIEIKHPGRLTALKERTGKTEAELWADGDPSVRKMITFARSARKWNHDDGGFLNTTDDFADPPYTDGFIGALGTVPVQRKSNYFDTVYNTLTSPFRGYKKVVKAASMPLVSSYEGLEKFSEDTGRAAVDALRDNYEGVKRFVGDYGKRAMEALTAPFRGLSNKKESNKRGDGGFLNTFAIGGDMQAHGGDYSTGLTHVDEGGSHELNPEGGVQMGTDSQGIPNMVEEGETIFDDYVFSTRIQLDAETKKAFHLPSKKNITYAEASKKLEKEAVERPNDAISQSGLKTQLSKLAEHQERQKAEMQAEQAREMFESLSPEEQVALIQQLQQQEAMAQQAQMQAQNPEQMQYAPQEAVQMQSPEGAVYEGEPEGEVPPPMMSYGGRIRRYDDGGTLKQKLYKALGLYTDADFNKWAADNKLNITVNDKTNWSDVIRNADFINAIKADEKRSALAHAIGNRYDFGEYSPVNSGRVTITDITNGNWDDSKKGGIGWKGSNDLAYLELVKKYGQDAVDKMDLDAFSKAMMGTDAYKNTTEWLRDENNALMYLNTIMDNGPESARKHAQQFVKDGKWITPGSYNYDTVFGKVRTTYPGSYWHSVKEAQRGSQTKNFVQDANGEWQLIETDVPAAWKLANSYSWNTPDEGDVLGGAMTYNYYTNPDLVAAQEAEAVEAAKEAIAREADDAGPELNIRERPEWYRKMGLVGPLVGLGLMGAGVGRPNYKNYDAALEMSTRNRDVQGDYKKIWNYLTPNKYDIWFDRNRMDAAARAADRTVMNSSLPLTSKLGMVVANNYNNQIAGAEALRGAMQYNDAEQKAAADFNRGTNSANASAYNQMSLQNAEMLNRGFNFRANAALQAARDRMEADAGWYNALYGNVGSFFKGMSDLGRENAEWNQVARMAKDGVLGVMSDRTALAGPLIEDANKKKKKYGNG